jgi:predicted flavoprotein YhiN
MRLALALLVIALAFDLVSCYRIVVIGGGAAGYFAAIQLAKTLKTLSPPPTGTPTAGGKAELNFNKGTQVAVLEAGPEALSKVLISGGGRCNVMHNPLKGPEVISKGASRKQAANGRRLLKQVPRQHTVIGDTI